MKTRILRPVIAAVASLATLAVVGLAQADTLSDIRAKGKITAATDLHFAPFNMMIGGAHVGLNRELFDEVAKEIGIEVEYLDLPWSSTLAGLEAGKFDMVNAPVVITGERSKRYRFTLPMGIATIAIAKRASDASISAPADIAGKVVGSLKGSAQVEQLKAYSATLPKPVQVREYVTIDEALADLGAGRIQGVAYSMPLMGYAAAKRPEVFALVTPPFGEPTYFSWLMRPDDDSASLAEAINGALLKMHEDGRLAALNKKWFGISPELPTEMPKVN